MSVVGSTLVLSRSFVLIVTAAPESPGLGMSRLQPELRTLPNYLENIVSLLNSGQETISSNSQSSPKDLLTRVC